MSFRTWSVSCVFRGWSVHGRYSVYFSCSTLFFLVRGLALAPFSKGVPGELQSLCTGGLKTTENQKAVCKASSDGNKYSRKSSHPFLGKSEFAHRNKRDFQKTTPNNTDVTFTCKGNANAPMRRELRTILITQEGGYAHAIIASHKRT